MSFEFDFSQLAIKGKGSQGNILTKHGVRNIVKREEGVSTLGARDIWYDDTVKRLNTDERGKYLGAFISDDKIFTIQKSGNYKLMNFDLSNHFEEDMILIEKFNPKKIISAIYFDSSVEKFYMKRFQIESTNNINKKTDFIGDNPQNYLLAFSVDPLPQLKIVYDAKANNKEFPDEIVNAAEFIGLKSPKAKGKRLTTKAVKKIEFIEPLPYDELEESTDLEEGMSDQSGNTDIEKPSLSESAEKQKEATREISENIKKDQIITTEEDDTQQMELEF